MKRQTRPIPTEFATGFIERNQHNFIPEPNSGCWLWFGKMVVGYGVVDGLYAHRIAYVERHGQIPPDRPEVRHKCDTPACINPDHLICGTHRDNMRDCAERGRKNTPSGVEAPTAKLTDFEVMAIRAEGAIDVPTTILAKIYAVNTSCIHSVIWGKSWKHLPVLPRMAGLRFGERITQAKLTNDQVRKIKWLLDSGLHTHLEIGSAFGVSKPTITAINTGRNWRSVV